MSNVFQRKEEIAAAKVFNFGNQRCRFHRFGLRVAVVARVAIQAVKRGAGPEKILHDRMP
ncbi:MAG: hypothetical protein WAK26_17605 [Terracidiphilus sp.]